jgi:hypothetical protein
MPGAAPVISRDLYGDNDIGRLQTKGPADIFVIF